MANLKLVYLKSMLSSRFPRLELVGDKLWIWLDSEQQFPELLSFLGNMLGMEGRMLPGATDQNKLMLDTRLGRMLIQLDAIRSLGWVMGYMASLSLAQI